MRLKCFDSINCRRDCHSIELKSRISAPTTIFQKPYEEIRKFVFFRQNYFLTGFSPFSNDLDEVLLLGLVH